MLIQNGSGVTCYYTVKVTLCCTLNDTAHVGTILSILQVEAVEAGLYKFDSHDPINMLGMVGVEKKQ